MGEGVISPSGVQTKLGATNQVMDRYESMFVKQVRRLRPPELLCLRSMAKPNRRRELII